MCSLAVGRQTLRRHAEAWHDYRWYGRVRQWDGLIVLVRRAVHYDTAAGSPLVFRGYLVGDRNFVGSWRQCTDTMQVSAATLHEGPFAFSRVEEVPPRQTA